jgi:Tfp pilus assembly protein PilN
MVTLTLYSRPECHLCESLLADLLPLLPADVVIETVDVDSSIALERRYGLRIPVLTAGEIELSSYPLDRDRVQRFLEALPAKA